MTLPISADLVERLSTVVGFRCFSLSLLFVLGFLWPYVPMTCYLSVIRLLFVCYSLVNFKTINAACYVSRGIQRYFCLLTGLSFVCYHAC